MEPSAIPPPPVASTLDEEERESIEEFLLSMEDFVPVIPDEVTNYYLSKAGFLCPDIRVKRMIALATQKFISDIATDAVQYAKIRQQSPAFRDKRYGAKNMVLTMDDLSQTLKDYGISVRKPEYFVDKPTAGSIPSSSTAAATTAPNPAGPASTSTSSSASTLAATGASGSTATGLSTSGTSTSATSPSPPSGATGKGEVKKKQRT